MSDPKLESNSLRSLLGGRAFGWDTFRDRASGRRRRRTEQPPDEVDPDSLPDVPSPDLEQRDVDQLDQRDLDHQGREQHLPAVPPAARLRPVGTELPPFPQRQEVHASGAFRSFAFCVLLPTALAACYYTFIASNQYVSEFRFAVKNSSPSNSAAASAMAGAASVLGALGGAGATAPNMADNYIVTDYLASGQAVRDIEKRINLVELYSRPSIDWWSRFNSARPLEWFVTYWQKMTTAVYDPVTGIASVQVRAFSPEDAKLVGDTMLKASEELINRMVVRMQGDTVKFAEKEVQRGETRVKAVRAKLTEFRNKAGVIDPSGSLVASNSIVVTTLRSSLSQLETQMASLKAERLDASSPAVQRVAAQIKATSDQIAVAEKDVAKNPKGGSLSDTVAQFEQLDLERQFAQTMLTGAQQALDQARAVAAAQYLYVEPYVRPSLPESSVYPRRLLSIILVLLLSLTAWIVLRLVARSVREHYA